MNQPNQINDSTSDTSNENTVSVPAKVALLSTPGSMSWIFWIVGILVVVLLGLMCFFLFRSTAGSIFSKGLSGPGSFVLANTGFSQQNDSNNVQHLPVLSDVHVRATGSILQHAADELMLMVQESQAETLKRLYDAEVPRTFASLSPVLAQVLQDIPRSDSYVMSFLDGTSIDLSNVNRTDLEAELAITAQKMCGLPDIENDAYPGQNVTGAAIYLVEPRYELWRYVMGIAQQALLAPSPAILNDFLGWTVGTPSNSRQKKLEYTIRIQNAFKVQITERISFTGLSSIALDHEGTTEVLENLDPDRSSLIYFASATVTKDRQQDIIIITMDDATADLDINRR